MIILMYTSFDIYTTNVADSLGLWRGEKPSLSFTQVLKQFLLITVEDFLNNL